MTKVVTTSKYLFFIVIKNYKLKIKTLYNFSYNINVIDKHYDFINNKNKYLTVSILFMKKYKWYFPHNPWSINGNKKNRGQ